MGVLRTNDDPTFETQANLNNYMTDQSFQFSVPSRGSNAYFQVLPKNYAKSQIKEDIKIFSLDPDSTEEGIIQIFKADTFDNINGFKTLAKGSHPTTETNTVLDDCGYADDTAVNAAWTVAIIPDNDDEKIELTSNDDQPINSDYCIQIRTHSNAEGNSFYKEYSTPQDWSNLENINFSWMSENYGSDYRWRLMVYDSLGQIAYIDFNASKKWDWEQHSFSKLLFSNQSVVDWADVVKIEFCCYKAKSTYYSYFGGISINENIEHSKIILNVQLLHFGTNPDFTTIGDVKTLDDNFDDAQLIVDVATNKISVCDLQYGAARNDWKLIHNDYYGIYIHKPTLGKVDFYGSDTQRFLDGDLYSNTGGTLTALNKSLGFMMCTFSKSVLRKLTIKQDKYSPGSSINLLIISPNDFTVKQLIGIYTFDSCDTIQIEFDYSLPENIIVDKESHLYIYYQDSYSSQVSTINVYPRFHFNEVISNG